MDDRKFEIRCNANGDGQLHVKTNSLSVRVGQLIRRNGAEEMWDSVLILCEVNEDGTLTTKVVACHPDWDQQLQIARIESGPAGRGKSESTLSFDFTPVHI
jgi:hypothetical protein